MWLKVVFTQGENPLGRPHELTKLAEQRDQLAGQVEGFAIYIQTENGCPALYFSLVAAFHCLELLRNWGAVECDPVSDEVAGGLTLLAPVYGKL